MVLHAQIATMTRVHIMNAHVPMVIVDKHVRHVIKTRFLLLHLPWDRMVHTILKCILNKIYNESPIQIISSMLIESMHQRWLVHKHIHYSVLEL